MRSDRCGSKNNKKYMLLDEKIKIKLSKKNIIHFKSLGYEGELKDVIEIYTKDINPGSHFLVKVKCDVCGREKEILFQKYVKNIKNGDFYACSSKCAQDKVKKTSVNKFGSEYYTQTEEYKNSVKNTSIEKYGCEHFTQNEDIKNKVKKTNLEKYGSENPFKSVIIKEKIKNTLIEKYGVDNVFKSDEIKEKMRKTFLEKYGVDWSSKSVFVKDKIKKTNLEKIGVECYFNLDWVKEKSKQKYLEKYGVTLGNMTEEMKIKMMENKKRKWIDRVLDQNKNIKFIKMNYDDKSYIFECDNGHVFEIPFVNLIQRNSMKTTICTICNPIERHFSGLENQLSVFIRNNYFGEILENKKIIPPYEIDVYLPDMKLAFEFNELYWHNEINKESDYHLLKTELAEKQGIKLIHIYEDDWTYKQDIIKSRVLNLLGKSEKIMARKCEIREITDNKLIREFLEQNHLQGFVGSKIKIGLFYENKLVSLMTFGSQRNAMGQKSTEGTYEMLRFCNKLNINVVGGASRLFKYFIDKYKPLEVISYADRSWSSGDLYEKLGFNFVGKTSQNYYYIVDGIRKYRFNFRKDKLVKEGADPSKTEHEIMLERGVYRIYDSGSLKYKFYN